MSGPNRTRAQMRWPLLCHAKLGRADSWPSLMPALQLHMVKSALRLLLSTAVLLHFCRRLLLLLRALPDACLYLLHGCRVLSQQIEGAVAMSGVCMVRLPPCASCPALPLTCRPRWSLRRR